MLIEPTETESKQTLDEFVAAMAELMELAAADASACKDAPLSTPVRRLDDVRAARQLDVRYVPPAAESGAEIAEAGGS